MHATTFLHLLLASGVALTSATAVANMGPPKPKQPFTEDMMNTCGCDVPALVYRECQNIPATATEAEMSACVCESQNKLFGPYWRHHLVCGPCAGNDATGQDKFPELVTFMGAFNEVIGAIWSGCYYKDCIGCPGDRWTISTTGDAVCGHMDGKKYCTHIGKGADSGWAAITEKDGSVYNVSATFPELKVENAQYAMKTVEIPKSGYPKEDEEKKKDEVEKTDSKNSTETDTKNSTAKDTTTSDKSTDTGSPSNSTSDKAESDEKDAGSGAMGLKGSGFAAAFGLAVALFI